MTLPELREKFGKLQKDNQDLMDLAMKESRDFTAAEQEKFDKQNSEAMRLANYAKNMAAAAGVAFTNAAPAGTQANPESGAVLPMDMPGMVEFGGEMRRVAPNSLMAFALQAKQKKFDRDSFGIALNRWARSGRMTPKYAAFACSIDDFAREFAGGTDAAQITSGTDVQAGTGILLPAIVLGPIVPSALNTFREGLEALGQVPLRSTTTAEYKVPIITATAGGKLAENALGTLPAGADYENVGSLTGSIDLNPSLYHSGLTPFSQKTLMATDFDLLAAWVPALEYSEELALEADICSTMIADTNLTGGSYGKNAYSKTLATIGYLDLAIWNNLLPKRYQKLKMFALNWDLYAAIDGLTDLNGRPIFTPDGSASAPQNGGPPTPRRMFGGPAIRTDDLQTLGTNGHVLGMCLSFFGWRLRDAGSPMLQRFDQMPSRPGSVAIDYLAHHAFGYDDYAVSLLLCGQAGS